MFSINLDNFHSWILLFMLTHFWYPVTPGKKSVPCYHQFLQEEIKLRFHSLATSQKRFWSTLSPGPNHQRWSSMLKMLVKMMQFIYYVDLFFPFSYLQSIQLMCVIFILIILTPRLTLNSFIYLSTRTDCCCRCFWNWWRKFHKPKRNFTPSWRQHFQANILGWIDTANRTLHAIPQ